MINKVILIGNCGQDPEVINTQSGTKIVNVSLATSEKRKNGQGELETFTEWHKLIFFSKLADVVDKYVKKGSKLYVEGKITTRKWQDKDGNNRYNTEIIVNQLQMLDSKKSEEF